MAAGTGSVTTKTGYSSPSLQPFKGNTQSAFQNAYNHAMGVADFYLGGEDAAKDEIRTLIEKISNLDVSDARRRREGNTKGIEEDLSSLEDTLETHMAQRYMITEVTGVIERVKSFLDTFPHDSCRHSRLAFFEGIPEYLTSASETAAIAVSHLEVLGAHFQTLTKTEDENSTRMLLRQASSKLLDKRKSLPDHPTGYFSALVEGARYLVGGQNEVYSRLHGRYLTGKKQTPLAEEFRVPEKIFEPSSASKAIEIAKAGTEQSVVIDRLWDSVTNTTNTFGTEIMAAQGEYESAQSTIKELFANIARMQGIIIERSAKAGSLGEDGIDETEEKQIISQLEKGLKTIKHPTKEKHQLIQRLENLTVKIRDIIAKHFAAAELPEATIKQLARIDERLGQKVAEMNVECNELIGDFKETSKGAKLKITEIERYLSLQLDKAERAASDFKQEIKALKRLLGEEAPTESAASPSSEERVAKAPSPVPALKTAEATSAPAPGVTSVRDPGAASGGGTSK